MPSVATLHHVLAAPRLTYAGIAAAFAATLTFGSIVAATIAFAGNTDEAAHMASVRVYVPPGRLDRLCENGPFKNWELRAKFIYRELGVCASAHAPDGTVQHFRPSAEEKAQRAKNLKSQKEVLELQDALQQLSRSGRFAAFIHLGALPLVTALYLLWLKLRT